MPSTVYKGDLTEKSHSATRLAWSFHMGTLDIQFGFIAKAGERDLVKDTSVITFSSGDSSTPVNNGLLAFPVGMLVGSKVVFKIGRPLSSARTTTTPSLVAPTPSSSMPSRMM